MVKVIQLIINYIFNTRNSLIAFNCKAVLIMVPAEDDELESHLDHDGFKALRHETHLFIQIGSDTLESSKFNLEK